MTKCLYFLTLCYTDFWQLFLWTVLSKSFVTAANKISLMFLLQASAASCNKQHNPQLDFLLIICNIKDLVLVSETSLQLTMGWILSSLISFLACSSTTGGKVKEDVVKVLKYFVPVLKVKLNQYWIFCKLAFIQINTT